MARLRINGLKEMEEFTNGLSNIAEDIDEIAKDCINGATPTLQKALKDNIRIAANRKAPRNRKEKKVKNGRSGKPYSTGELERSIEPTEAKTNAYGNFAAVRPVGRDKSGIRNGEKLAYLEYGTSEQEAHPVLQKTITQAEPQTKEIIQKRFEEHIEKRMKQ